MFTKVRPLLSLLADLPKISHNPKRQNRRVHIFLLFISLPLHRLTDWALLYYTHPNMCECITLLLTLVDKKSMTIDLINNNCSI